jgi:hypothetical protein
LGRNRRLGATVDGLAAVYDLGHGINPVLCCESKGEREIVGVVLELGRHLVFLPYRTDLQLYVSWSFYPARSLIIAPTHGC